MEEIKKFFERLRNDEELQAKVKAELEQTEESARLNRIVEIAKELGYNFTAEEFLNIKMELSEEDLDNVAGGNLWDDIVDGINKVTKKVVQTVTDIVSPSEPSAQPAQPAPQPVYNPTSPSTGTPAIQQTTTGDKNITQNNINNQNVIQSPINIS